MKRTKKGFSLVECAVALALIAVIAATAFSTVVVSAKLQKKYDSYLVALHNLENISACYKSCYQSGNYENALEFYNIELEENLSFYYTKDFDKTVHDNDYEYGFFFTSDGLPSTEDEYDFLIKVYITKKHLSFSGYIYDSSGKLIYKTPGEVSP